MLYIFTKLYALSKKIKFIKNSYNTGSILEYMKVITSVDYN